MPRVDSSAIERVAYDGKRRRLLVTFRGKGETNSYAYLNVPRRDYDALLAAPSKGAFVNTVIKPRYRVEPIAPR